MTLRAPVAPQVIAWALERSGIDAEDFDRSMPRLAPWLRGEDDRRPTFNQVQVLAQRTQIPLGYLFLSDPPTLDLPIPDFRQGYSATSQQEPSTDLLAVIHQSMRRQDWYRDYAETMGLPTMPEVGRGKAMTPAQAAADMRERLSFSVERRSAGSERNRKHLLRVFEQLGGLSVATSMVGNNTSRLLDPEEFRGFTLVDAVAPLIFVNTRQTLNGQLFTIAHEVAHVWSSTTGVSREEPFEPEEQGEVEKWCNAVASEFLVPGDDLPERFVSVRGLDLVEQLEALAKVYRCGTLVILQALRRHGLRRFADFGATYEEEASRVEALALSQEPGGGTFWNSQPFRIGDRFGRAVVRDTLAGNTSAGEAIRLTGLGSLSNLQRYSRELGEG